MPATHVIYPASRTCEVGFKLFYIRRFLNVFIFVCAIHQQPVVKWEVSTQPNVILPHSFNINVAQTAATSVKGLEIRVQLNVHDLTPKTAMKHTFI